MIHDIKGELRKRIIDLERLLIEDRHKIDYLEAMIQQMKDGCDGGCALDECVCEKGRHAKALLRVAEAANSALPHVLHRVNELRDTELGPDYWPYKTVYADYLALKDALNSLDFEGTPSLTI